jgi:hypothetical protein
LGFGEDTLSTEVSALQLKGTYSGLARVTCEYLFVVAVFWLLFPYGKLPQRHVYAVELALDLGFFRMGFR